MINFRYHVVSLVAVFLAMAIGVVAGTTVIDKNVVDSLESQRERLSTRQTELRAENDGLRRELDLFDRFGTELEPRLVANALKGRTVFLVVEPEVHADVLQQIEAVVVAAGGETAGRLGLTSRWALADQTSRERLALALGVNADDADLSGTAAPIIAQRLLSSTDPRDESDLVAGLERADFATLTDAGSGAFPPRGALAVFVTSGLAEPSPPDAAFMLKVLTAVAGSMPTVVAESLDAVDSIADRVRGDRALRKVIATVDHIDTAPGRIALVDALRAVALGGTAPHYGVRRRTSGVIPRQTP